MPTTIYTDVDPDFCLGCDLPFGRCECSDADGPGDRAAERAQAFAEMAAQMLTTGTTPAPRNTIKPLLTSVFRACLDRDHPDYRPFTPPNA